MTSNGGRPNSPSKRRPPFRALVDGFRCTIGDTLVLVGAGIGAAALWGVARDVACVVLLAVGHFFLFCNVFRVRRAYELAWAALFVVNMAGWLLAGGVNWGWALAIQLPTTAAVIGAEMAGGGYHGIGWRVMRRRRWKS